MLRRFSVENFKGFKSKFVFDLSKPGNYGFNQECVKNGLISKAAIYGINGIGKSNFGRAIFDLVIHLTEKNKEMEKYKNYINLDGSKPYASFEYEFQFDNDIVNYSYRKMDANILVEESLSINGKEMLYYNYLTKDGFSRFVGSEALNLQGDSMNSRVKYVMGTAVLADDDKNNKILNMFKDFVERMLLFYSLRGNGYMGFKQGAERLENTIIEAGKLKSFEDFLNSKGLHLQLSEGVSPEGNKIILLKHKNRAVPFFSECSTGMESLILLYSWLITLDQCSFVYIDEFDAFYHYELAEAIVNELKKFTDTQIVVTTHNTDLMSNDLMRPDCYFVLNDEKIDSLNRLTEKDLRLAHNLQKLFKAKAFNK